MQNVFGDGFPSVLVFFLQTNRAQMMEEKPGLGLQSGRAIDALIRVGTIKQPVCGLGNTLSPANYLPEAQKLSDSSNFFQHNKKKQPTNHRSTSNTQISVSPSFLCHQSLIPAYLGGGGKLCSLRAWEALAYRTLRNHGHGAAALIKVVVTAPSGTVTPAACRSSGCWAPSTGQRAPDQVNVN